MNVGSSDPVYGIYSAKQVTSVLLASPSDTLYDTMHVYSTPDLWDEMGWALWGSAYGLGPNCSHAPTYNLYTYQSNDPDGAYCFPQYAISPGEVIYVFIESNQNNSWSDWVYWNGEWNLIFESFLSQSVTVGENTDYEAYTNFNGSFLYLPETGSSSSEVALCNPNCGWYTWTPSILPQSGVTSDAPYAIPEITDWYNWYGCGPTSTGSC